MGDVGVDFEDLGAGDAVLAPGSALGVEVEEQGLKAVKSSSEAGFGAFAGFEFLPELAEAASLVGRQQAVEAVRGGALAFGLQSSRFLVVDEGIAGVDLHDVVHEQHGDDARDVGSRRGVVGQYEGEDGDVPGVLGVVFAAFLRGDEVAAQDALGQVEFQ